MRSGASQALLKLESATRGAKNCCVWFQVELDKEEKGEQSVGLEARSLEVQNLPRPPSSLSIGATVDDRMGLAAGDDDAELAADERERTPRLTRAPAPGRTAFCIASHGGFTIVYVTGVRNVG